MPLELADPSREQDSQYERLRAIAWSWRGVSGKGIALRQTTVNDDSNYAGDFANGGSGSLALRATAGSHSLTVTSGGISLSSLTVSGNLSVLGNTTLGNANSDSTTIQGSLTQSGGAVSLSSPTTVSITATGAGTLTATSWSVVGPATLSSTLTATGAATFQSTLTAQGNVTVRNGATGATLALFDVSNTRLLVGSGTALTSAADDRFSVIGGMAYFAGNSGPSLGLRYSSSETTGWTIGLAASGSGQALQLATTTANTSSLVQTVPNGSSTQSGFVAYNNAAPTSASVSGVFRANATNLQIRCDSPSGSYQPILFVTNNTLQASLSTAGAFSALALVTGAYNNAPVGSEQLRVAGASRMEGIVSVIGATVDLENNRSYRASDGTTQRNLAKYDSGGVAQFAENGATGAVVDAGYVQLKYNGTVRLEVNTTGIGAYGASPVAKPTVTGSRAANAALASLLSALASIGWVTDSSTA